MKGSHAMNIAAYCRVSTDKSDQLNSLETQKKFFAEFAEKNGHNMVRLYADEGISGTKIKNRREFLRLMQDARQRQFEMVVVKDISRFARNTVDFLQSIRTLKELDIETVFLTSNQKVLGNSEFVLTIFAALAQEESANTSKRVKFGKRVNAQKGRVPNIVFGYDKIAGDYFNMDINPHEAAVIRDIYDMYLSRGMGALKIANVLNEKGIRTKRSSKWTQNAVCRILTNPIYTGRIINGKEEVKDFLTGERIAKSEDNWIIVSRPELQIISDEDFQQAGELLKKRHAAFNMTHERQSSKHLYSTLIRCSECGYSFRRSVYRGNVRWICSGRNSNGTGSCPNRTIINEADLTHDLQAYFSEMIVNREEFTRTVIARFNEICGESDSSAEKLSELKARLRKLEKKREKYMDMYVDELISRNELNTKAKDINEETENIRCELRLIDSRAAKGDSLQKKLENMFSSGKAITAFEQMTNTRLRQIISKITVDKNGKIDVYLDLLDELKMGSDFRFCYDRTQRPDRKAAENKSVNVPRSERDT